MRYYFAGGLYPLSIKHLFDTNPKMEFGAVHPTGGLPYIWTDLASVKHISHHASVYEITKDFDTALLVKDFGTVKSPKRVSLSLDLKDKLIQSVALLENEKAPN